MIRILAILASLSQPVSDIPTIEVTPHHQVAKAQRVVAFMAEYFEHFSSPNVLDEFRQDYADFIEYYGKLVDRVTLIREKARFVQRWPERRYRPRRNSIAVSCLNETGSLCLVTGLVDFDCHSEERHASSSGVARFRAAVMVEGDSLRIISEDSEVVG